MSQPQLFTIDFLGIGSDENGSPQLDSHQHLLHKRSMQSCLGKIKPYMLQQVLSHGCRSDSQNFHSEGHIGVCEGIKTMDLFPQHPLGFQSNGKQESALLDRKTEICEDVTTNPSSPQLTIFYNGAVKVYNDVSSREAEAIIMLAAANEDALPSSTPSNISNLLRKSVSNPEESTQGAKQSHAIETSNANLPIAKKLSLQRFLQKRKDRVSRVIPYATSSK
ncbi:hypothetical protein SUGI_1063110 [Cryptomeria japonica]|uniref:protein TIFY 3B-like n=1 Tax=Cryptomeria japonica TaxID=3369 RepID=UPI00241482A8|nr:protein TIFY 3B-like [Cryptomeria japonica]GLJ49985.1 hypothetical protein SUGI_1063110 [Cryptomeria japonica]